MSEYSAPVGAPIWFDLMSSDPQRAADFYGTLFGWEAQAPRPEFGGYQNFVVDGRRVAGLSPYMDGAGAPSDVWSVYLHAPDIGAMVAAAESAGATVIVSPMAVGSEGTMAVVVDPAGASIGFWQPDEHAGFTRFGEPGAPYWFDTMSQDYEASTTFYPAVTGTTLLQVGTGPDQPVGPNRYAQMMTGEISYAGIMDAAGMFGPDVPSFWQVHVFVDDVAATTAAVERLGGTVLMPGEDTPYGTLAAAKDPMGANFCYASPPAGM